MNNNSPAKATGAFQRHTLFGVPEGYDSVFLADLARSKGVPVLHVCADDLKFEQLTECLAYFAPDVDVLRLPAWDCLPYDRVSPTAEVVGERLKTLSSLLTRVREAPLIVLTTSAAVIQRVIPKAKLQAAAFSLRVGETLDMKELQSFLSANGYHRSETVRASGEYALRGGLIDIFPSGAAEPLRLDLFGDEVEKIRAFDALSQRTTQDRDHIALYPVSEVLLGEAAIHSFREKYRELFGAVRDEDALYESISQGRIYAGMEHWLPLFYEKLETISASMPSA